VIQTGGSEFTAPHFHSQRPHLPQQYPNLRLVNPAPHLASSPQAPGSAEPQLGVLRTSPPPNKQPKALDCCQNYSSLSRTECAYQPSQPAPKWKRRPAAPLPTSPSPNKQPKALDCCQNYSSPCARSAPASHPNKPPQPIRQIRPIRPISPHPSSSNPQHRLRSLREVLVQ
jgi:hypothetical protein